MRKPHGKGFTLVELLVVIAILGLLSAIAAMSLSSARSRARDTKRIADIRQIASAMQLYYDATGSFPNPGTLGCSMGAFGYYCLGHGNAGICWNTSQHGCTALDDALATYIAKIPDDPENAPNTYGDSYLYSYGSPVGATQGPLLHFGLDQVTNANICMGGSFGQWSSDAAGRSRYWCATPLR